MKYYSLDKNIKKTIKVKGNEEIFIAGDQGGSCDVEIILDEANATCNLNILFVGNKSDNFRLNTKSRHTAPNTKSYICVKGIFFDSSYMDYDAKIIIEKKAKYSDAYLKNDNLLIGNDSSVDTKPQLEIFEDDVKASHGVTVSDIDSESKFYLMSRGISEELAENIYVKAFVSDIVQFADEACKLPTSIDKLLNERS